MLTRLHLDESLSLQIKNGKLGVSIQVHHLRDFERFVIIRVEKVFFEEFWVDTAAHAISNVRSKYSATHTFQQRSHSRLFSHFPILSFFPNERHVGGKYFECSEFGRSQVFLNGAMFVSEFLVNKFEWLLFLLSGNASSLFLFDGGGRSHYYVFSKVLHDLKLHARSFKTRQDLIIYLMKCLLVIQIELSVMQMSNCSWNRKTKKWGGASLYTFWTLR